MTYPFKSRGMRFSSTLGIHHPILSHQIGHNGLSKFHIRILYHFYETFYQIQSLVFNFLSSPLSIF